MQVMDLLPGETKTIPDDMSTVSEECGLQTFLVNRHVGRPGVVGWVGLGKSFWIVLHGGEVGMQSGDHEQIGEESNIVYSCLDSFHASH